MDWNQAFSQSKWLLADKGAGFADGLDLAGLDELKDFMDVAHARECLIKPYCLNKNYPVVEPRALLPSFETDLYEYHELPGFSQIILDRPLLSFSEIFQYDIIYPVTASPDPPSASPDPPPASPAPPETNQGHAASQEHSILAANLQTLLARLPRAMHEQFRKDFQRVDAGALESYPDLLPYILRMDRAHVVSKNARGRYQLSGVFASLPSDIDGELKRFGMRIGKFHAGDNELYERNRLFVMQFLMELYGFPISSERRTSAALFARRLHKIGEKFMIRVLGQSDRVITSIWNSGGNGANRRYPHVEKMALVRIDEEQKELLDVVNTHKAFVDKKNRVVLIKVQYRQHGFDPDNVRQDRALSVSGQQIIHPLTGVAIDGLNIIRDSSNLTLCLNDIVRGEFSGRIVYKRTEIIENTDSEEKRLKFLYAWLTKHQRRFIGYSDEFFANTSKILDNYFTNLNERDILDELGENVQEVETRYRYIQQARKLRFLQDIRSRNYKGERLNYDRMLHEAITLMQDFKYEVSVYFEDLVDAAIHLMEGMLNDRYLRKSYIEKPDSTLTRAGQEIRRKYGKLVVLHDEVVNIRKTHQPVAMSVM